jgi:hypothetical protein
VPINKVQTIKAMRSMRGTPLNQRSRTRHEDTKGTNDSFHHLLRHFSQIISQISSLSIETSRHQLFGDYNGMDAFGGRMVALFPVVSAKPAPSSR